MIAETISSRLPQVSVVITGRNAPGPILEIADTVSVISDNKHYYASGIEAQAGMEY